jgi:murein DD-endopeptidase MepM/ murein hydrolase activator NlpD
VDWPKGNFSATLISDERFSYDAGFYAQEIQVFLEEQNSALVSVTVSVGEGARQVDLFSHALAGHCIRYSLNPKVLLTLLELQVGAVRKSELSEEDLDWAFGFLDPQWRGLDWQLQWAAYVLADGFREADEGEMPLLTDGTLAPIPGEANAATRAVLRLLAYTADAKGFDQLRSVGSDSFVETYRELFGQDPRLPLDIAWEPTRAPFLRTPFSGYAPISSYFDHEYPIFRQNGSLLPYSGERGQHSYDGHDGWDYVLSAGTPVLAAARGQVAFAGMLDTLCPTPAGLVVIDHGEGYRSLYWHLERVDVEEGQVLSQGERIGTVGNTGCSSGPHLHFGVQFLGRDTDPYGWCGSSEQSVDPWAVHPAGVASRWLWADKPSPCPVPAQAVVVDELEGDFGKSPALWYEAPVGYGGHAFWTVTVDDDEESTHRAVWRPNLPKAGRYFLYVYVPWYDTGRPDTIEAHYTIRHAGGETTVTLDQAHVAGLWAPLGVFSFEAGSKGYVYLSDITQDSDTTIWFDVIVWVTE